MDYETVLNGLISLIIIVPAMLTIYLATRISKVQTPLRILTLLLGGFLLMHGMYHLLEFSETALSLNSLGFVSDSFVEPASWAFFVAFAAYYLRRTG